MYVANCSCFLLLLSRNSLLREVSLSQIAVDTVTIILLESFPVRVKSVPLYSPFKVSGVQRKHLQEARRENRREGSGYDYSFFLIYSLDISSPPDISRAGANSLPPTNPQESLAPLSGVGLITPFASQTPSNIAHTARVLVVNQGIVRLKSSYIDATLADNPYAKRAIVRDNHDQT